MNKPLKPTTTSAPNWKGLNQFFLVLGRNEVTAKQLQLLNDIESLSGIEDVTTWANPEQVQELRNRGWIEGDVLTEKARDLFTELDNLFLKPKKTIKTEVDADKVREYNNLFPQIKIPTSGKYARTNTKELVAGFAWFLSTYPEYTWDIIFKATAHYVQQKQDDNWQYMRTSRYFLRKQDANKVWTSDLADYCMQVVEGVEDGTENHFQEKII